MSSAAIRAPGPSVLPHATVTSTYELVTALDSNNNSNNRISRSSSSHNSLETAMLPAGRGLADRWLQTTACKESKQCAPAKHHYDECVERVTGQDSEGGAKEDCVEECKSELYKPQPPTPLHLLSTHTTANGAGC